ncbi:hypothetical protein AVEN_218170-1 [Araneus ventricosus]|uniref:Uncharacterized protein n=1 Tax=Araneus ventricosus TaxID=182803 RepID=A0A4Y2FTW4_ARAVE|nr:hypothetical protein AVEN_218170-1 [Araneus ventricosus]
MWCPICSARTPLFCRLPRFGLCVYVSSRLGRDCDHWVMIRLFSKIAGALLFAEPSVVGLPLCTQSFSILYSVCHFATLCRLTTLSPKTSTP